MNLATLRWPALECIEEVIMSNAIRDGVMRVLASDWYAKNERIAALESEVAALTAALTAKAKDLARAVRTLADDLSAANRNLEDRDEVVAAFKKDVELLNWLEANPDAVGRSRGYLGSPDSWFWKDAQGAHHNAPTLRAAIDSARNAA